MAPPMSALEGGNPDEDDSRKAERLAARAARFSNKLPGNKYKQLEEARIKQRKVFEDQGLIKVGKTELGDAVDMKGTCEKMCSDYEREFREYTREIHPFEAGQDKRMDPGKAVAAYSRSDAGAGHGESAILPSDLRTPVTLVHTLDYLFSKVMPTQPPDLVGMPTARKALGYTAGFIRDRTRAIRKEFAMQSSWGHDEAISSFERIARWHILCLRELQEETGMNSDMHIDSAELGRCFTSLRQHYNDRREELGVESPCPNEAEFQAYMLIFNLSDKSVAIPTSELPSAIIDHPLVRMAWEIRRAAQRNFDSQKEGSKLNAELGANMINLFVKLLRRPNVPYLLSCLVEIRLREMRRSALRALTRTYPRLRSEPIRVNDVGEIVERRMVLIRTLDRILGCEEQEDEDSAYDDVDPVANGSDQEAVRVIKSFQLDVFPDVQNPMGALINLGSTFNDNNDAPYTRRWQTITAKRQNLSFVDVVNGKAGIHIDGSAAYQPLPPRPQEQAPSQLNAAAPAFSFKPTPQPKPIHASTSTVPSAFDFGKNPSPTPAPAPAQSMAAAFGTSSSSQTTPSFSFTPPAPRPTAPAAPSTAPRAAEQPPKMPLTFDFGKPAAPPSTTIPTTAQELLPKPPAVSSSLGLSVVTSPPISPTSTSPKTVDLQPPRTPSAKALGKRPEITPSPRSTPRVSEAERHRNRNLAPALRNRIIRDVIEEYLSDLAPDLLKAVKQEQAARLYTESSKQRHVAIATWTHRIYEELRKEAIWRVTAKELQRILRARTLQRKFFKLWREAVKRQRRRRQKMEKEQKETFRRFESMGLGGSFTTLHEHEGHDGESVRDDTMGRDELVMDVALQEAAMERSQFFAPTTFLNTIARHVSTHWDPPPPPLPQTPSSGPTPFSAISKTKNIEFGYKAFETVVSLPIESKSSALSSPLKWIKDKFTSPDSDEDYERGHIFFDTTVLGRFDEEILHLSAGLVVFATPPRTSDPGRYAFNIADAQDRMVPLTRICSLQSNRYNPCLLILTWEKETLDEVISRLEIFEDVQVFEKVAVMSLQDMSDIDSRLESILLEMMPYVSHKKQVVLEMRPTVQRISPIWDQYLNVTRLTLHDHPTNATLAELSFVVGLEVINELPFLARSSLGHVKISPSSTFEPIILPAYNVTNPSSVTDLVENIASYLEDETFSGLDELSLTLAPLHHAATTGRALPIADVLTALSLLVFGEMAQQDMPLLSYWNGDMPEAILTGYLEKIDGLYSDFVDERIREITSLVPSSIPEKKTLKRGRMSSAENLPPAARLGNGENGMGSKESKAAKNARLLKAMEDVSMTLEQMNVEGILG